MAIARLKKEPEVYKKGIDDNKIAIDRYYDQILYILPERKPSIDGYIRSITPKRPFPERGIAGVGENDSKHPVHHLDEILKQVQRGAEKAIRSKRRKRKMQRRGKMEEEEEVVSEADGGLHCEEASTKDEKEPVSEKELSASVIPSTHSKPSDAPITDQTMLERMRCVPESEILGNKLDVEEIRKLKSFSNYSPGEPSNALYLKNLSNKVNEADLVRLFGRYEDGGGDGESGKRGGSGDGHGVGKEEGGERRGIVYRLMQGRMKGQAFVRFPCTETAQKGLELLNGFVFKGKPLVIQFARNKT